MRDLEVFLAELEGRGLLERLEAPYPRVYGASRLIAKKEGGPAIVFRVEDSDLPCVSNLADTRGKLRIALGVGSDEEMYRKIIEASKNPGTLVEKPFDHEKRELDVEKLPVVKYYERDGGLYVSSSIIVACRDEVCNASIHRMMVVDKRSFAVRVVPRHLYQLHRESGGELRVAVAVGVHPAALLASSISPPLGVFEMGIAAKLMGGRLEAARTPLYGIPVPRHAGVVMEGRLTSKMVDEGPFVDIMGTYDRVRRQPVLKVDAIYVNPEAPYFHLILPGGGEHRLLMGLPKEAAIWEAVSRVVPRVHKVRLTPASGGWLHAVISIDKTVDSDAKNAILAAFAGHPSLKHVVVVDADIDPDDSFQVEWAIATRFQAHRDLVVISNARISSLDPSSEDGLGSKVGVDATKPVAGGIEYERARIP